MTNLDGTAKWPQAALTPLDRVGLAMAEVTRARADVARARIHEEAAHRERDAAIAVLEQAIVRLFEAARGGHQ